MRKRVLLLACALGVLSVVGFTPQAQAACTSVKIFDRETRCVEDIVCDVLELVHPSLCPIS
ncbi:MAG TPA: hypothetical protein VG318_00675 [Actinomycetota bacterium]|nr:hypothetical protein [Actinomycetota bacterium]